MRIKQRFESGNYVRLVKPVSFLTVGEEYQVKRAFKNGYLQLHGDMLLHVRCDLFEDARPIERDQ